MLGIVLGQNDQVIQDEKLGKKWRWYEAKKMSCYKQIRSDKKPFLLERKGILKRKHQEYRPLIKRV